jgi:surface protein
MFNDAEAFNNGGSSTIGNWNTSLVTTMTTMFQNAKVFNQNISSWNVNKVISKPPSDFSTNTLLTPETIPYWYLSLDANGVTVKSTLSSLPSSPILVKANLRGTLEWFAIVNDSSKALITSYANPLAGPAVISYFTPPGQTSAVPFKNIVTTFMTDMSSLFAGASSFNSDISSWDTSRVTDMNNMFNGASVFNQNIRLWDVYMLSTRPNQPTGFSTGSALANNPTNMPAWNSLFLDTDGVTIKTTITYSFFPLFIRANLRGTLEWFAVVNNSFKTNITNYAKGITINGSSTFIPTGQTTPVLFKNIVTTLMTDMSSLFSGASSFNSDISSWDVSRVTDGKEMFLNAFAFNQNIGSWNTSVVTNMSSMFQNALVFNNGGSPTIGNWDTTSVTNMGYMFNNAIVFNQNISGWNVANIPIPPPFFITSSTITSSNTPIW